MGRPHVLVIPAERFPSDHSFLEEVHSANGLRARRTLLMRGKKGAPPPPRTWNDATLHVMPSRPANRLLGAFTVYFFDVRFLTELLRLAASDRPHVIYIRDLSFALLICLMLRPHYRWKVIYQRSYPHELSWFDEDRVASYRLPWLHVMARRVEWVILRYLLGKADVVVPISSRMGEDLIREGLCKNDQIRPFGMGVADSAASLPDPPGRSRGGPLELVYVGTLASSRRLTALIDAIKITRNDHALDVRLTLLGGTADDARVIAHHAAASGLSDVIRVPGRVPRSELYPLMARAHAGAIFIPGDPRYRIASTTKLLESLALGLPCVATDAVAMHQDLAQQTGAMVITDDTVEGFAAGIVELDRNWDQLSDRARESRTAIYDQYSYESARIRMDNLILSLVEDQ